MNLSAQTRPDFLVIGAQKCATSWLYYCLKEHPRLHLPRRKREVECLGGDLYEERGADWYFSLLDGKQPHQKAGDVSVDYLFDRRCPRVVHEYLPEVQLIVSLREPIARATSAFHWYVRKGHVPDWGPETGLAAGMGQRDPQCDKKTHHFLHDTIERGFYAAQLERYRQHFGPSQFLVVLYEDIARTPLAVLQKIYRFLDVDPSFVPPSLTRTPKKNTYSRLLISLERFASKRSRYLRRAVGRGVDIASPWLGNAVGDQKKSPLSVELQHRLRDLYQPHNERLQELLAELPPTHRPDTTLEDAWT